MSQHLFWSPHIPKSNDQMEVSSTPPPSPSTTSSRLLGKAIDVFKVLPSVGWLIMCLFAIPSYSAIGWKMPVVCAILSSIISVIATYDICRFHRRYKYLVFGTEIQDLEKTKFAEIKLCFGCTFALTSLCLCIAFLAVGYSIPPPVIAKDGCHYGNFRRPATGYEDNVCATCAAESRGTDVKLCVVVQPNNCNLTCTEIRDLYVLTIEKEYPPAGRLCPAPPDSANTFVSFSCLADGFWMMVTSLITFFWVSSLVVLRKRSHADLISIGPALTPLFRKNVAANALRSGV